MKKFGSVISNILFVIGSEIDRVRKCLAEYTVHNLVTLLVLLTVLRCRTVLPDGHFCNNAILHACVQEKFRAIPSTYWCNFKRFKE